MGRLSHPGLFGWALVITSILTKERKEGQSQRRKCESGRSRSDEPQVKECGQPPKAGKGEAQVLPWSLWNECRLANTLILALGN